MKVFKATICILLTVTVCLYPLTAWQAAFADENGAPIPVYAYVDLGSEVYFCAQKDQETALFIIPQTYCVQILAKEEDWYKVRYAEDNGLYKAVEGYCLQSDVVITDEPPQNLYLNTTVTVTYRTDAASPLLPALQNLEFTAAFYGNYKVAKTTCSYVYCNDYFGYTAGAIENYPLNELPKTEPVDAPVGKKSNTTLITALAITAVAAAAVIVLYFTGKRPPKTSA